MVTEEHRRASSEPRVVAEGVSVVIPLFNKASYISETLASVTRYGAGPLDVVVVDDGSTDGSAEVVRSFKDERIRLVSQTNRGLSETRNVGISLAQYELLALIDADDWWYEGHLENLMKVQAAFPQVDLFSNNFERFGRTFKPDSWYRSDPWFLPPDAFLDVMARVTPMNASSVLLRRPALEAVGGFPVGAKHGEDYAVFVRLGLRSGAVLSPFVGAHYRQVPGSMSRNRLWAPGGGMRAVSAVLRSHPSLPGRTGRQLKAIRARWALEYASSALRRGNTTTARRFLALSQGARGQLAARVARLVLANLPAPLGRRIMASIDRLKGRK